MRFCTAATGVAIHSTTHCISKPAITRASIFVSQTEKKIFQPRTQGEHKISRGFTPVSTWSAHWLARPEFFAAVANYLEAEERHIDRYIEAVNTHSPYRNPGADQPE